MFSTIVAALVAASPSPSPSPTVVPQIAHVVTSDRGLESAARAARTTYVVTAAQIARDGDRTVADAIEDIPGVNVVRYGAFGAAATVGIRGSSSQQILVLVDGLPMAGSQIDDVNLEQLPDRRHRSHRSRRGRRLDALRFRFDRRRDQHHHRAAARAQHGDALDRIVRRTDLSFPNAVRLVPAHLRRKRLLGRERAEPPKRASGLNEFDGTIRAPDRRRRRNAAAEISSTRWPERPASSDTSRRPANRTTSIATCASTWSDKGARSSTSLELGDSSQDLSYTCDTPVDSKLPELCLSDAVAAGMTSNPPYAQVLYDQHWMASLRNVVGDDRERLVYGVDLLRGIARIDQGTGGGSPLAADDAPIFDAYAQTAAYVQSQWFGRNGEQLYAGLRAERDGGVGGAYSPSVGGIAPLAAELAAQGQRRDRLSRADRRGALLSRLFEPESGAGANASRRCDARRAGALGRRHVRLVHDERHEPHRFAAAGVRSAERRPRVDRADSRSA